MSSDAHPRYEAGAKQRRPIVLTTHEFFPRRGGVGAYVQALACAAARRGHAVSVAAPRHARWTELDLPITLEATGRTDAPGRASWRHTTGTARYLLARRRALAGRILHLAQQGPLRAALWLQRLGLLKPARLVITLHGSELLQLSGGSAGPALGRLLARADRIAVLSRWVHDELARRYPAAAERTVIAPGAPRLSIESHGSGARATNASSSAPSFGGDATGAAAGQHTITVLTVGRIHPRKGQATLLKALARLDGARRRALRWVIVGPVVDPAYAAALRRRAGEAGLAVEFAGEVEDTVLARHYADADLFALTSEPAPDDVEGFGLAYLDASAAGLPILAHRTGGVPDAVAEGETGLLVEPGDDTALDEGLGRLLGDRALRARLGASGRSRAWRWSWDACAATVYEGL